MYYIWRCTKCKFEVEIECSVADRNTQPEVNNSECDHDMYRPILPSTFILAGGGWFADGYSKPK